ncbi:MAG: PAS domain-containing protein [Myxococcaceae bacterium]|nr:PAS domain-containing protein [Myxococcaceae bacterium]
MEHLLRTDDIAACAQHCLEWLAAHAGVQRAICAGLDEEGERLVGNASVGVSPLLVAEFWIEVEERNHPLIATLRRTEAVRFSGGGRHPITPLGDEPFIAVPLGRQSTDQLALGLLLLAGDSVTRSPNVQWVVEILSDKFLSLRSRHLASESRFGRERSLLHGVINAVSDPILLTDSDGRLVIANTRAENLFVSREDESEGRRRAVSMNNMLLSAALAGRAMERDHARNELLLVDPNEGSDLLFELMSQPVREGDGEVGIVSVLRNVTDLGRASAEIGETYEKLQLAQARMQSERHRLDLIIDSVADPIIVTDAAGDIMLMNKPAERLFTVQIPGNEEAERRVRSNDAHFSSFISNLLFSGSEKRVRGDITLVDQETGESLPVEAIAGKILSPQGELTTVVTILHDQREALEKARLYEQLKKFSTELEARVQAATAELAEQNELLRRQAVELEQASAAKSQFLANMSHEFRTPLNAILGYTSMLLQGVSGKLLPAQQKALSRIDSNGRHLLDLINEILDITRIESGKMPLHISRFELQALIDEVFAELDPIISRSPAQVTARIPANIPELETDRQKLKQIVVNLISNALKFTHEGRIRVVAGYNARSRMVTIAVSDTGIGIAEEYHQKVFEDFRQVDASTTRAYGGTGLGLSICRRLSSMLGGRITLKSKLGKGSTFTLHIPRKSRRP